MHLQILRRRNAENLYYSGVAASARIATDSFCHRVTVLAHAEMSARHERVFRVFFPTNHAEVWAAAGLFACLWIVRTVGYPSANVSHWHRLTPTEMLLRPRARASFNKILHVLCPPSAVKRVTVTNACRFWLHCKNRKAEWRRHALAWSSTARMGIAVAVRRALHD
jgi:hypothetical protein